MTLITLEFLPHLAKANTEGRKTRTIRRSPHGKPGDVFFCEGIAYRITFVKRECLLESVRHYSEEGYTSTQEFLDDLVKIYSFTRSTDDIFYVHYYCKWGHLGADRRKL